MDKHKHKTVQEDRECFLASLKKKFCTLGKDTDLHFHLRVNLAGLGELTSEKGKELLASRNWSDRSKRKENLEEIKRFLNEII